MIEITPGRELDKAVAKAIGWTRVVMVLHEDAPLNPTSDASTEGVLYELNADNGEKFIPRYSSDLNAAYKAVEKVSHGRVQLVIVTKGDNLPYLPAYMCTIDIPYRRGVFAMNNTPALAICAAILKLKEHQ